VKQRGMAQSFHPQNVLIGNLDEETTLAIVSARELESLETRMREQAGRDLHPGELFSAAARELNVQRVLEVRCPYDTHLAALLRLVGPGRAQALQDLPDDLLDDLENADIAVED
jgi:hypothetical protein